MSTLFPSVQPTITAGAYSAGDVVGGLMTFTVGAASTGSLLLRHLTIGDADNEKAAMDIWVFHTAPTVIADNGAFSTISDAEIRDTCLFHFSVAASDYTTAGSNALAEKKDINRSIIVPGTAFYVYAVCSGTPSYGATTDLRFTFEAWPEV